MGLIHALWATITASPYFIYFHQVPMIEQNEARHPMSKFAYLSNLFQHLSFLCTLDISFIMT